MKSYSRLPAVVPVILYNGSDNWTAVRNFKEYVQGYEQFGGYIVDFKYFLLDLNRMTEETILSTNELLDIIFALDQTPNRKNMERMLKIATENLGKMNDDDRNDMLGWLKYIYLNCIADENTKTEILHRFERGDITNMMYGMDMYIEKERKKAEAKVEAKANKEKLEIAKSLLDVLDVETIAKKFNITVKEVEALKK